MDNPQNKNPAEEMLYANLANGSLIDALFGFACKKCFSRMEAEELTQEILAALIYRMKAQPSPENFYAYVWQIARNVYADHVNEYQRRAARTAPVDEQLSLVHSFEEDLLSRILDEERLAAVKTQMAYLSQTYRDVMVMFYFDELPINTIAQKLKIPPNRVKQRLFSAREKIRKEVSEMNENSNDLTNLKPFDLWYPGSGDCVTHGDPRDSATTLLAKNIIIACRDKARSAEELAKQFNIPAAYIESELNHMSGKMLADTGGGKYISSNIVIDMDLVMTLKDKLETIITEYASLLRTVMPEKEYVAMSLPYTVPPRSFAQLKWILLPILSNRVIHPLVTETEAWMKAEGIEKEKKAFYVLCEKLNYGEYPDLGGYSQNNLFDHNAAGYSEIFLCNFVGKRLPWECGRFGAGGLYPVEFGDLRRFMYRTIGGGLDSTLLTEGEKELAAQAIAKGYIRKEGEHLFPDIPIMDWATRGTLFKAFDDIQNDFISSDVANLSKNIINFVKKHVPRHLLGQADVFVSLMTGSVEHLMIEACLENGLLTLPNYDRCNEGIWAVVTK